MVHLLQQLPIHCLAERMQIRQPGTPTPTLLASPQETLHSRHTKLPVTSEVRRELASKTSLKIPATAHKAHSP